jgi:V/A-type H+-transporting ATPase subunit B
MSLSRLMRDGIGEGKTRSDHPEVASQLYAAYARAQELRALALIVGESSLTPTDLLYLRYGETFERKFLAQSYYENRDIWKTLDLAWEILSMLPESELTRIKKMFPM